ncbi:ubiquitin carboxyl-terminal hydrolase 25-like isoform X3 [Megalops cyprinoides]|uniref:ubiquitin carboxyl-terminal hydrolase 25-like isoform X3 n=1 Tax=Megalops cyprinoides TaxID=118141 RepID=UPI0018646A31|nr:ubiquitin carboxyl-terminal hydrolase 25-like isoform X3 [Megalops cyprinoides]
MTVEQNVLQQHSQKYQQILLNQLRDLTGTTDIQLLNQALQFSNGELAKAVAFLTASNAKGPQHSEAVYHVTAHFENNSAVAAGNQEDTGDEKDDLQRAIALSLEESSKAVRVTGITDEEQDISRVLEVSLAESKARQGQTHTEAWMDSPNPHERKRLDTCPVGLKNVGNTCWFSAVIQSLFNLLEFQRLVLHYCAPKRIEDLPHNHKERRILLFMQELRRLFALMLGSKWSYVDPSRAVDILKDDFQSSDSQQQQDVSEFTHKLLDWLEDAFQMKVEEESEGERQRNPMVELFYGHYLAEGVLEGKKFENTEMFGQFPLQVNGFKDLHECLEAAMTEREIEVLHAGNSSKSGQEHWFTELPPVLTFELSRFEFNQALGRPEKIHSRLEFPLVLYMDRYVYRNRDVSRIKREEMRSLREHLTSLQQCLERYLSYGSGPKRIPLADVLQYAMEFASSKASCTYPAEDSHTATPSGGSASPLQATSSEAEHDASGSSEPPTAMETQLCVSVHKPAMNPAPRHATEEELQVLQACLHRWRGEVDTDTQALQGSVSRILRIMELMYTDKTMMQVPYRLHAVLVHEGEASSGHYWAYVYSLQHRGWIKYNDIAVTASSWDELMHDSFGGDRNASAYCLMYVNDKKPFLLEEDCDEERGQVQRGVDSLPQDLREYVTQDNLRFESELAEWDAAHAQTSRQDAPSASPQPGSSEPHLSQSTALQQDPQHVEQRPLLDDCRLQREETERAISHAAAQLPGRSAEVLLSAAIRAEYARLVQLARESTAPKSDHRLRHPLVYFVKNEAPKSVLERTLFEQFADRNLRLDDRCKAVVRVARVKLDLLKTKEARREEYEMWHRDYRKFRHMTVFLLTGVELFQKRSYAEALVYLVFSSQYNKELLSKGPHRGHDQKMLAHYRRVCLLELNDQAAAMFETGDAGEVSKALNILSDLVVPCLPLLLSDEAQKVDVAAAEDMRNRWCSYLGQEMDPSLQKKLTDVLPKLLDCPAETVNFQAPPQIPSYSTLELCEHFSQVTAYLQNSAHAGS